MIKTILFDLDGTLLPMDQDVFVKDYFSRLANKLAPHGYDPKQLVDSIWAGTAAMIKNDGSRTNEEVFWEYFSSVYGEEVLKDMPLFDEYYRVEFQSAAKSCGFTPEANAVVKELKEQNYRVALATNPIFPKIATESRIRWAGLEPEDFELFTAYENTGFSKPNPRYFLDVVERLGAKPEECLMVGNDVEEDMVAAKSAGINIFLLTDCMINKKDRDISEYPHGGFSELRQYIKEQGENF